MGISVAELAKKFNKEYKDENLFLVGDVVPKYDKLPIHPSIAYTMYGGLPIGRIITLSGVEHSGKTLFACQVMAAYQKMFPNKTCVYVDVEHTLDLEFMSKMTGLNLDKVFYMNPSPNLAGESILQLILDLYNQADDIGTVILDSLPALVAGRIYEDNDLEKDQGMRGHMATHYHKFLPQIAALVQYKKANFIMINQVRVDKVFNGVTTYKEPGGKAPAYYSSNILRFSKRKFVKDGEYDLSDSKAEGATGFRLHFAITKSKTSRIGRGAGFITYDYEKGLDLVADAFEIAKAAGYLIFNGSHITFTDPSTGEILNDEKGSPLKFHGSQKAIKFMETHKEFTNMFVEKINKALSDSNIQKNLGSNEELEAINKQQAYINEDFEQEKDGFEDVYKEI